MNNNLTKFNYNGLFLRDVLIGLSSFIKDKIKIIYRSEEQGEYTHTIPFYFKQGGDTQFLVDSFIDDIPDQRVHSNTDVIPRAVIDFSSWNTIVEDFTNPTVWYDIPSINDEGELENLHKQIKWVPLTINGTFEFCVDSIMEQWVIWQEFIISQFNYSYFTFEYNMITIQAHIEYGSDTNNAIQFNKSFSHEERIIMPFNFTIKTHLPIFDSDSRFSNKGVLWNYVITPKKNIEK